MRSAMILAATLVLVGCETLDLNTNKAGDDAGSSGQVEPDASESQSGDEATGTDASEPQASDDVTAEADTNVMDDDVSETDVEESDTPAPMPCADLDGDGICTHNAAGEELDCDDENSDTYKNAPELCDGVDNNCDGQIDDGVETWLLYADHDGDGYGAGDETETCSKVGFASEAGDCNDSDPDIYPGADDPSSDGVDNNCDDEIEAVEEPCDCPVEDESLATLTVIAPVTNKLQLNVELSTCEADLGSQGWSEEVVGFEYWNSTVSVGVPLQSKTKFVRFNLTIGSGDTTQWLCTGSEETAALLTGAAASLDAGDHFVVGEMFLWSSQDGGCSAVYPVTYIE